MSGPVDASRRPSAGSPPVEEPSPWVRRWAHLVPAGAHVLDFACGSGRHVRWFVAHGCRVTGVDRDVATSIAPRGGLAAQATNAVPFEHAGASAPTPHADGAEIIVADLEVGAWPLAGRRFDAVVVTNYLWRPRWPELRSAVAPGGLLIYETFARGQETVGRPRDPKFLLQPGELLELAAGWRVVAYEDGFESPPDDARAGRFVQRIVATKPPAEGESRGAPGGREGGAAHAFSPALLWDLTGIARLDR